MMKPQGACHSTVADARDRRPSTISRSPSTQGGAPLAREEEWRLAAIASDLLALPAGPSPNFLLMDWTDQHYRAFHRLMRRRTLYAEMVASAARVELNRSDLCKGIRSCSIISVPGSAVTKRASGVSSGILVHQ